MRLLTTYTFLTLVAIYSCSTCLANNMKGPIRKALTLPELEKASKVIFKGTVISSEPVEDNSFKERRSLQSYETVFKVISIVKGEIASSKHVRFRHYRPNGDSFSKNGSAPQSYNFDKGKHYFVCANLSPKKHEVSVVLRQIWDLERAKADQGFLSSINDKPHRGENLSEVYWNELTDAVESRIAASQVYAIRQLNSMSSGTAWNGHQSFDREKVVGVIASSIDSNKDAVATAAMKLVLQPSGLEWKSDLIRLNPKHFPGHAIQQPTKLNLSAQTCSKRLIAMANSRRSSELRAFAVKSLLNTANAELFPLANKWSRDDSELVRAEAATLLTDFVDQVPAQDWKRLMDDSSPIVRASAIRGVGRGQIKDLLDDVETKLEDKDSKVVASAAASLLSFPLERTRSIFQKRIKHPEYGCLFVIALASEKPDEYLDELGQIVRTRPNPQDWWGGSIPWGVAWNILFEYALQQNGRFSTPKVKNVLASLESPIRESEKSYHFSSSQPRDLYALYVQNGMQERAASYREAVNAKTTYDMELYFNNVDKHPGHFLLGR